MTNREMFERARDFLILHSSDYNYSYQNFKWPQFEEFNWALDYFDEMARGNQNTALWLLSEMGHEEKHSFETLRVRSNQVANYLTKLGVKKGESLFLLIEDHASLWELQLAAMKIGATIIPNNPLLSREEFKDRLSREKIAVVATTARHAERFSAPSAGVTALLVDGHLEGWTSYSESFNESSDFAPQEKTKITDPLFKYFVSGKSVKPKMIEHNHGYPIGHLATMFWMGVRPGDIHLGINSPGWSMDDWNNFIVPWNAQATVCVLKQERFSAKIVLDVLDEYKITTFCATPTVWKLLAQEDLSSFKPHLREALSTGGSLSAETISIIHRHWGIFVRDGYCQTETSLLIGVPPAEKESFGTMGKVMPGFKVSLLNSDGQEATEGEIALRLSENPYGLMMGADSGNGFYRTGDSAFIDSAGNLTFTERTDGLFKSSDYRISPFEIEFVLRQFPAIRDVVVIPSPDPIREAVPKALIDLNKDAQASKQLALDIMHFARLRLSPFKRVRRIEFREIPKNTEGEILRSELVHLEKTKVTTGDKAVYEFWEEDAKIPLPESWAQDLP